MKRLLLTTIFICGFLCLSAQNKTRISVFVTGDIPNKCDNLIADELVQFFLESNKYIPINRSRELNDILKRVHAIQEDGHIDTRQIANATKAFAETQVCGVNVYTIGKLSIFSATIIDLETEQIIKSASTKVITAELKSEVTAYDVLIKATKRIANQLIGNFHNYDFDEDNDLLEKIGKLEEEERKKVEKREKEERKEEEKQEKEQERKLRRESIAKKTEDYSYLGGTFGGLYPWNFTAGLTARYGSKFIGIGGYIDLGMDFEPLDHIDANVYFRMASGVQLYICEGLNIDIGYCTLPPTEAYYKAGYDKKYVYFPNQGLSFRLGYQNLWNVWGLGIGAGGVYNFFTKELSLSINLKFVIGDHLYMVK